MKKICLMLVVTFMLSLAASVFASQASPTAGSAPSLNCASFSRDCQVIINMGD